MAVATQQFSGTYVADPHHSSIVFGVRHMNVSVFRASFADVEARLVADDAEPTLPLPGGGDALGYEVELTVHLELKEED